MKMEATIKWVVAGVLAAWAGLGTAVQCLLIFMALDYATGMIAAWMKKQLSSEKGFRGLGKKVMVGMLVAAAHLATKALGIEEYDLGAWVATAYSINELISITENCHRVGVPIPAKLIEALEKARSVWDGSDRRSTQQPFLGRDRRQARSASNKTQNET